MTWSYTQDPKTLNLIISHFLTVIATVFLLMTCLIYIINQSIQYTPQFWYDYTYHNFDMICLFETYWDSSYADDDTRLDVKDFTLIRANNPHNCKRGVVSISFKEHLALCPVSPLNLDECLVLQINIQNKEGFAISLYRSLTQSKEELNQFLLNFEQLIFDRINQNPHFILVTGDFNVWSSSWWKTDLTANESNQLDAITSPYGWSQLIWIRPRALI